MTGINGRVLIISEVELSAATRQSLTAGGFDLSTAEHAGDGYQQLLESPFDLVIVSLDEPSTGVELIKRIRSNSALKRLLILLVAEWGTGQATMALAQGANAFEPKPLENERLLLAVARLLQSNMVMSTKAANADREVEA